MENKRERGFKENRPLISPDDLKSEPFFKKGTNDNDLFTDSHLSAGYISEERMARLLAEAIPALTLPAGANYTEAFTGDNNFNMQTMQNKVNGVVQWPAGRERLDWYHNDIKDVAYLFVNKVFNILVEEGKLK